MKKIVGLSLAALTAACVAEAPPQPMSAESESRLDARLAGRVAGPPVACVRRRDIRDSRPIDQGTLLFQGNAGTVYVNRVRSSCPSARPSLALRSRSISSNMCEGDLMVMFDPRTGIEYGGCSLGAFTPYRRAR